MINKSVDDSKIVNIDGKKHYAYNFPRSSVAVDCVVFGADCVEFRAELPDIIIKHPPPIKYSILLIQRKNPPFENRWALPGGFVDMHETSEQAAIRELKEETSIDLLDLPYGPMKFIGVFDKPNRDPRGRVISIIYSVVLNKNSISLKAADDAKDVEWHPLNKIPNVLAFDHNKIIDKALKQILHD